MKFIEQRYKILSIPENPLELLEKAARNCYRSEGQMGCMVDEEADCPEHMHDDCNGRCEHHSSRIITNRLIERGHEAMIEFGTLAVRLITNRGVMAEITRHRHVSFAIESTRYCNYGKDDIEFIRPCWWDEMKPEQQFTFSFACRESELHYKQLIASGQRPEQAREVLNHALATTIVMSANFREWRHILKLRTHKTAHPQIRDLLTPLLVDLKKRVPVVFDDI